MQEPFRFRERARRRDARVQQWRQQGFAGVQRMRCPQVLRHSRRRLLENDDGRDRSSRNASSKSPFVAQRVYLARSQINICRDVAIRNHISKALTGSLSTYRLPNKKNPGMETI